MADRFDVAIARVRTFVATTTLFISPRQLALVDNYIAYLKVMEILLSLSFVLNPVP